MCISRMTQTQPRMHLPQAFVRGQDVTRKTVPGVTRLIESRKHRLLVTKAVRWGYPKPLRFQE